nr:hypothetical protein [Tanacetum cinerariifolium]
REREKERESEREKERKGERERERARERVEAEQQFAEIMNALKALQPPTTLLATIPRFEENRGQSFSSIKVEKERKNIRFLALQPPTTLLATIPRFEENRGQSFSSIKVEKERKNIRFLGANNQACVDIIWKLLEHLCALSLDKLAMPPHLHRKFRIGVAIAKGCRGYYKPGTRAWVSRGSRKIRIPIDMYPCRVEERLTIKSVKGEKVLNIETTVTAKDGTITKFLRKFSKYKPTNEKEEIFKLKAIYENVIYDISDSDSDLESTAKSGPRDGEMEDTGSSGIRIKA